jgi:Protein of unknown function (DUF2924)
VANGYAPLIQLVENITKSLAVEGGLKIFPAKCSDFRRASLTAQNDGCARPTLDRREPYQLRQYVIFDAGKDLLGRMMACRLQEQAFGSLDRESLRFLDGLARHGGAPRRQLKPGTVLVRDYQGQRHTVTVAADGFNWQGTTYPSLSAIARAITGTAWSGPRFFALARGNGRPSAHAPHNKRARAGRNGLATGSNKALLPLQTASRA